MFGEFFHNIILLKCLTSLFIALIQKVNSPLELGSFRHVSLLGYLYNIIVKMLVIMLERVMQKLISPLSNQPLLRQGSLLMTWFLLMKFQILIRCIRPRVLYSKWILRRRTTRSIGHLWIICCRYLGLMVGGELRLQYVYFREASMPW